MKRLKLLMMLCLVAIAANASKTVYLAPGAWDDANANERYAIWMFGSATETDAWAEFSAVDGVDGIFSATFNEAYTKMSLVRLDGDKGLDWANKWAQTADMAAPAADGLLYTMTGNDGETAANNTYTISIYGSTAASFTDGGKYLFKNVGSGRYLGPGNSRVHRLHCSHRVTITPSI